MAPLGRGAAPGAGLEPAPPVDESRRLGGLRHQRGRAAAAPPRLRRRAYAAGYHAEALDGWPAHPAYVLGNERVSCALCVLASRNDLVVGARHNPEAFEFIAALEERTGSTFRPEGSLRQILAAADAPRPPSAQLTLLDALAA